MKPPFVMSPDRLAQAMRPGGRPIRGRADYVWVHGVLIPLALGAKDVQVRRLVPVGPWHRVTLTEDEAYDALKEYQPLRPGLQRAIENHRSNQALD